MKRDQLVYMEGPCEFLILYKENFPDMCRYCKQFFFVNDVDVEILNHNLLNLGQYYIFS